MKKIFIASALFITATVALSTQQAKAAPDPSDQTTLNVILSDVKTIEVMDASVDILINDAQKYIDASGTTGVSVDKSAHLKVTSTGGFSITVSAADLAFGTSSIDAGKILIAASNATTAVGSGLTGLAYTNAPLSTTGSKILNTDAVGGGTPESTFDVNYKLSGVADIANLPAGTYSTVVTYTLTAP